MKGVFVEVHMLMTLSEGPLPIRKKFRLGCNLGWLEFPC